MEIKYINIFKGVDLSERKVPILIERGKEPGPTIWLCAGTHGDEVSGIEVIQRIFNYLKRNSLKKGTLYAIPLINPMGFEMIKRENPYDEEDMNRNFPGDPNGNTTERITSAIFSSITETKPDLVMDLHADSQKSIPYIIIDKPIGLKTGIKEAIEKSWEFAEKFGITVMNDIETEGYKKYHVDKSMTAALITHKQIPAFSVELGGPKIIDERFVRIGINGIKNILSQLGMIEEKWKNRISETKIKTKERMELVENITASESGMIEFLVKPGQFVKKGNALAKITNVLGKIEEIIFANRDCYIIALNDYAVSFPGDSLLGVAVPIKLPETAIVATATAAAKPQNENDKTPSAPKGK